MSVLDIEDKYPDEDFWLEEGFFNVKKRGVWINSYTKHLHWKISDTGSCWGNIKIYIEYHKYSKMLTIFQGESSFYYDEVDFEPIELHNPTQREIELALTDDFLSSRLTYKHK